MSMRTRYSKENLSTSLMCVLRRESRMSQYQLGSMLGTSQSYIVYIEKAKIEPTEEIAEKLEKLYGYPIEILQTPVIKLLENLKIEKTK